MLSRTLCRRGGPERRWCSPLQLVAEPGTELEHRAELPAPLLEAADEVLGRGESLILEATDDDGGEPGILEVRSKGVRELPHLTRAHRCRVELYLHPGLQFLERPWHEPL